MAARVWSSLKTGETESGTFESGVFVYRVRFRSLLSEPLLVGWYLTMFFVE